MLKRLRERAGSESGFTLIELLVVMLILGILAAIAIPAFLNQKSKASDASLKSQARSMQTAMETCATDNGGSYTNCSLTALNPIESTIPNSATKSVVSGLGANTYTVTAKDTTAGSGNTFSIARNGGTFTRDCTVDDADRGGCPGSGTSPGTW